MHKQRDKQIAELQKKLQQKEEKKELQRKEREQLILKVMYTLLLC